MLRRVLSILALLSLLSIAPSISEAVEKNLSEPPLALVHVALPTHDDLVRFQSTGLPAYARLHGSEGDYLLVGASPADLAGLEAADLSVRILDTDVTGENEPST